MSEEDAEQSSPKDEDTQDDGRCTKIRDEGRTQWREKLFRSSEDESTKILPRIFRERTIRPNLTLNQLLESSDWYRNDETSAMEWKLNRNRFADATKISRSRSFTIYENVIPLPMYHSRTVRRRCNVKFGVKLDGTFRATKVLLYADGDFTVHILQQNGNTILNEMVIDSSGA
ncbi:uncharacterized protein LOC124185432 [Neodiprion fabricii]|uniref:uncharacterized protein LOC124185432 n=1 Tax=Neodiprion fabricii TaxID=2872261 RepID=UPI001ED9617D|nr:uncharacterized protein LOC124185432 [Neodiprion fabricii]